MAYLDSLTRPSWTWQSWSNREGSCFMLSWDGHTPGTTQDKRGQMEGKHCEEDISQKTSKTCDSTLQNRAALKWHHWHFLFWSTDSKDDMDFSLLHSWKMLWAHWPAFPICGLSLKGLSLFVMELALANSVAANPTLQSYCFLTEQRTSYAVLMVNKKTIAGTPSRHWQISFWNTLACVLSYWTNKLMRKDGSTTTALGGDRKMTTLQTLEAQSRNLFLNCQLKLLVQ